MKKAREKLNTYKPHKYYVSLAFLVIKVRSRVKKELQKVFGTNIDLATIDNDSETFRKYVLKDAIYV